MDENTVRLINDLTDKLGINAGELHGLYTIGFFADAVSWTIVGVIIFIFGKYIKSDRVFDDKDLFPIGKAIKYAIMFIGLLFMFTNIQHVFYPEGAAAQALLLSLRG